jgi:signal transduction histidine kinase
LEIGPEEGRPVLSLDSKAKQLSASAVLVALATLLTRAAEPVFGRAPLLFFFGAVIAAAAYGTFCGLLTTALGLVSIRLAFGEIHIVAFERFSLTSFLILGIAVTLTVGHLRKTNRSLRDVKRDLESTNRELSERTAALAEVNREIQQFAFALAHDLKAPVRAVSTLTELLVRKNEPCLNETSREYSRMILDKTKRMQTMIEDLLNYAAVADSPAATTRINAGAAVTRAIQDLDAAIVASGAEIIVDPLPDVDGVESQLTQVFANLIENAIKYAKPGQRPSIHISAKETGNQYVISVQDDGIGLDMKYADQIFGMFQRLHGEREYEGTGIGLALCRAVIQRHGGRIWVQSELGKGSKFFFTLPLPRNHTTGSPMPLSRA